MKKLLFVGLILLITIGIFAFARPEIQKKERTPTDWQTYENKTWGFSFNYPADWELNEIPGGSTRFNVTLTKEDTSQEKILVYTDEMYPLYSIQISAEENKKGETAMDWYLSQFKSLKEFAIEEVEYDGVKGVKYPEGVAPASGEATAILFATKDNFYRFIYSALATTETHTKYLPTFEKILDSIKFKK